jgi:hypothetical protein
MVTITTPEKNNADIWRSRTQLGGIIWWTIAARIMIYKNIEK